MQADINKHTNDILPKYMSLLSNLQCYTLIGREYEKTQPFLEPVLPRESTAASSHHILIAGILYTASLV